MTKRQYLVVFLLIGILTLAGAVIGGKMAIAQSVQGQRIKGVEVTDSQKWEYRVVSVEGSTEKAEAIANALGQQGFEMVSFSDGRYSYQFVFKRHKPQ
ncbi:MAG TPA: hypothetical protein VFV34_04585 [Blastocatellia bacterium]|nr:hypothetical protein [Blastocatellia bacterium]